MSTWERLGESAVVGHGITLQPAQVKEIVADMRTLSRRYEFLQNMNVAYMTEYGPELFYELTGEAIIEGELDAETSDDSGGGADDDSATSAEAQADKEGQAEAAAGDDAQGEAERNVEVPEVQVDDSNRSGYGDRRGDDPHSPYVL